jgi:hypothetical protein
MNSARKMRCRSGAHGELAMRVDGASARSLIVGQPRHHPPRTHHQPSAFRLSWTVNGEGERTRATKQLGAG